MKNIGFVGVGNIASAIINGLNSSPLKKDLNLFGFNAPVKGEHLTKLEADQKITSVASLEELIQQSDYIIFALKPEVTTKVLSEIDKETIKDKVLLSVAAGVTIETYNQLLGDDVKFIRVMPNVNAAVGEAMVGLASNVNVQEAELNFVTEIFNQIGETIVLNEELFPIFTAMAGSFPAAVFILIDSLANVGLEYGLTKAEATKIALQVVKGSVKFAQIEGFDQKINIRSLTDLVSSPGGTTINGIWRLEENGFSNAIEKSVIAMMEPKVKK